MRSKILPQSLPLQAAVSLMSVSIIHAPFSVLCAVLIWALNAAASGDRNLTHWTKGTSALIGIPPLQTDEPLVGWRDPFIFEQRHNADGVLEWGMLMGSGRKNIGGSVMIYRSADLTSGVP